MNTDTRHGPTDEVSTTRSGRRPFVLAPFRGLRFDPQRVGDLGSVISPPYDVLDAETVRELEAANRRNIVRLILSRGFDGSYRAVLERLEQWREKSFLRPDPEPALYLYQYTVGSSTVRGLVGLVELRAADEGVILPHEDVMPGPVADRTDLMGTTQSNLEPILLVHEGTERLRARLQASTRQPALAEFTAPDGSTHVLWAITDSSELRIIADELAPSQVLIADGHHRYAAYLRLQATKRDPSAVEGTSPWDHGLALVVDQHDYPLQVGPIHRVVAGLTFSDVQDLAAELGDDFVTFPDREAAFAARTDVAQRDRASFVLSDGRTWAVLTTARTQNIDAAVLHEDVFHGWRVCEQQVSYSHSFDQALQLTASKPGVVVAVQPPSLHQVMDAAARGVRMPRKSTSFAPKPAMGVVMRDLRDR